MPRYKLTPEVIEGLKPLSLVSRDDLAAFLAAVEENLSVSLTIEDDLERFAEAALPSLEPAQRSGVCDALTGIQYLLAAPGPSESAFFDDVEANWIAKYGAGEEATNLRENIRLAAASRVLRASIKAGVLLSDDERVYLNSRVLTDVRPVFQDDVDSQPLGSLLVHTLKINTRSDNRTQSLYVALDTQDLKELRNVIDRALDKVDALRGRLTESPFSPTIGLPDPQDRT